jgi:hypothetical protein
MNLPNNLINKCPAIRFAVKRTERVKGRIILLTISIITIKNINAGGVPKGTICANILKVLCVQPNNIKDNQRVTVNGTVNMICAVGVKTYGNKEKKLNIRVV